MARRLVRGDVHLCRFPPPDKERPAVVLTQNSAIGFLSSVTVAPITSSVRNSPSQVILDVDDGMKGPCAVNLHNVTTVSQARLGTRIASLSSEQMERICRALRYAIDCDCD